MPTVQLFLRALIAASVPPSWRDFGTCWALADEITTNAEPAAARATTTVRHIVSPWKTYATSACQREVPPHAPPCTAKAMIEAFGYRVSAIGPNCGEIIVEFGHG